MSLSSLEKLDPVSFAFVMATAIVSIAFKVSDWPLMSFLFLSIGAVGYGTLILLFGIRMFKFPGQAAKETGDVLALFKYLTFCAGTNSLAVSLSLTGFDGIAWVLGIIGAVSTIILVYTIFFLLFFRSRLSIQVVSPYWLLMAIACNSVGIVITTLWGRDVIYGDIYLLISFCFWSFGILIYLIFMTLNIFRMFFVEFTGKDLYPAYWTCMGAAAIAVVDGCNLSVVDHAPLFRDAAKPFIDGMDLILWTWGTSWIPILGMMEVSKYFYFKMPYRYHPSMWAIVFPLGMYTVATYKLSSTVHLEILNGMVPYCLWTAVFCWTFIAFSGIYNPQGLNRLEEK